MIKPKKNKCHGVNKAINHGCGELVKRYKYGLCHDCFFKWLNNTPEGKEYQPKLIKTTLNKVKKESKVTRKYVKWTDKPFNEMQQYVQSEIVNPYIRLRDIENFGKCISSGNKIHDAGHFYSVGSYPNLRYCCQNIHGQNRSDNGFKGGNLLQYKIGLLERFPDNYVIELAVLKNTVGKFDKSELIEIGKTYEHLTKKRIWCFRHEEFENYKKIINK
jgi:hypothetical protein